MKCSYGEVGGVDGWHSQQWLTFLRESLVERCYHPRCSLWLRWQHHCWTTTACRSREEPQEIWTSQASSCYNTAQEFNVNHMSCVDVFGSKLADIFWERWLWMFNLFVDMFAPSTVHRSLICMSSCHSNFTHRASGVMHTDASSVLKSNSYIIYCPYAGITKALPVSCNISALLKWL